MGITYVLRTDKVTDEEGKAFTVYGITAIDIFGAVLETVPDIFFDKEKAEGFVALCNSEKLELCHLLGVCEDQLA